MSVSEFVLGFVAIIIGLGVAFTWPSMISFALAVLCALTAKLRVHAPAIAWIFAVTLYNNLFMPIGQ